MAITTLNGVASRLMPPLVISKITGNTTGVQGVLRTTWYQSGMPVAATANTSGLSGAALTAPVTGQIPFTNPTSGNSYLAQFSSVQGALFQSAQPTILIDRLWHNSGLDRTLATAQTVNSAAWPARDANGSTNGEGVYIGVEISTAMGTGTPTITMSYTNSAGTAGRTGVGVLGAVAASSSAGWIYVIGLDAGDTGVRSVQSVTFSATWGTAGVLHLIAFRPLMMSAAGYSAGAYTQREDAFTLGMPRLYDGAVLQHCRYASNGIVAAQEQITIAQG